MELAIQSTATDAPKWTDIAQAWGSLVASMLTLLALAATIWLAYIDRKRSDAALQDEIRRGQDEIRRERALATSEQLRLFRLDTLMKIVDTYTQYTATSTGNQGDRARLEASIRALLHCIPDDLATLIRLDVNVVHTKKSQGIARAWMERNHRPPQRPVPPELVALEIEDNIERLLPRAV